MPEVTQLLCRGVFKLAGPLSHQPTSGFPETSCNQRGWEGVGKHHRARGRRGALTSSFWRVFLSSSILCCICFMV